MSTSWNLGQVTSGTIHTSHNNGLNQVTSQTAGQFTMGVTPSAQSGATLPSLNINQVTPQTAGQFTMAPTQSPSSLNATHAVSGTMAAKAESQCIN